MDRTGLRPLLTDVFQDKKMLQQNLKKRLSLIKLVISMLNKVVKEKCFFYLK